MVGVVLLYLLYCHVTGMQSCDQMHCLQSCSQSWLSLKTSGSTCSKFSVLTFFPSQMLHSTSLAPGKKRRGEWRRRRREA